MAEMGLDSSYVPGVMPGHEEADPTFCHDNALTLSQYADGYWVFFQETGGYAVEDYMLSFEQANEEIYPQPQCISCGDMDHTGEINWADLSIFATQWLWTGPAGPPAENIADLDCSGRVDLADLGIFAAEWLGSCP